MTPAQMDRWARASDNWAVTDTLCFKLFDQTPHAWAKAEAWCAKAPGVREARGPCADRLARAPHQRRRRRALSPRARSHRARRTDERNFVKKGASWALRAIGQRKDPKTKAAALALAQRLAASPGKAAAFIGRDALKALKKRSTPD